MTCPKCGFDNPIDRTDCLRCGVIFAKIRERTIPDRGAMQEPTTEAKGDGTALGDLLFCVSDPENSLALWCRAAATVLLAGWGAALVLAGIDADGPGGNWLGLVNTPFHEAGHVLFRPFGSFMRSLGGTLGQLLVPLVCLLTLLLKTRDPFGAAVCLWWFGQNFLHIAPYINDARTLQLPLLGGNFGHSSPYGFHDWEYLLTESALLPYDHAVAAGAHGIGSLLMAAAVVWAWLIVRRQFRRRA